LGVNGFGDGIVNALVGLANPYGNGAASSVLPIVAQLQISLGLPASGSGLVSSAKILANDEVSFPLLSSNLSPFIGTSALAQDPLGQVFVAQALTNQGQAVATNLLTGYSFSGYEPNNTAFACSATPASCQVDLLPTLPVSATGALTPQVMTIVPTCQSYSAETTTYRGTLSVQVPLSGGGTVTLIGTFAFAPDPPSSAASGTQTISNCYLVILGTDPDVTTGCTSGSYTSATRAFQLSTTSGDATLTFSGTATQTAASANVTTSNYVNLHDAPGSGTFTGVALTP
jgi:hypothetical protein